MVIKIITYTVRQIMGTDNHVLRLNRHFVRDTRFRHLVAQNSHLNEIYQSPRETPADNEGRHEERQHRHFMRN